MNKWNERFTSEEYVYGTAPNEFLEETQQKLQLSGEALAIAEGEGRNAVFLAEQGMKVTAWDYAPSGLEKTKKLAKARGTAVQTELMDLEEAQWEGDRWDEIVCIFGHFPEKLRRQTLLGIKKAVKPGGYFVAEVYSLCQLSYKSGGPKDSRFLYAPEEFWTVFSDWRIVHFFMGEVVRHEGELHNGLSHVIQFAGQKPEK
ncbi:SAM-dependent methyltransferase [Pseudobacillus badius]|uniref:SAM-dependent methyltransferase n=1 Tax=Bacillus badius TaxID=1455 RepID=UPI0007B06E19|nr:class I SAM-dependent methyltransferase [Bacillus badius]KZN99073.1 tellurite resistance methyltransferase TehB [Bacillus badius]MED0665020.1 methyltransferase domain-containing protein [Bacillus badius]OCS84011.1 tellurite resistance methyltransferase TehB [Bacillus badius]OVE52693.1 SAM-dependent methyltransferase [Bacillus badius]TDW04708.1 methyltransferase family protein [Bacillus badius]